MSIGATQAARPLAIATPLGEDVLLLNSIVGSESLSTPFQYDLELESEEDGVDPAAIVGHNVTVRVEATGSQTRYLNGFVSEFTHVGWADRLSAYRARIVPWLWFLDQTADCRIFQQKTTPEIIQQIFKDLGFTDYKLALSGSYPPWEYCVQYRETDFNFVSRLLEEEGIYYFFRHENGKHVLTLADATSAYFDIPDSDVEFPDPNHDYAGANRVTQWQHSYSFRPGKYTHTDYNFKTPSTSLAKSEASRIKFREITKFEVYDYHGRHEDGGRGQALAKVRLQELEARHDVATGHSYCGSFTPGGKFTFAYHRSQAEIGKTYVLTSVDLSARLDNYTSVDGSGFVFENRFTCIPAATLFRPQRRAHKPVVEGPQTAVIVGPSGEEIYVDEFSRVKAQFHWDREGQRDENSSCWMRVSQAHAGAGWGYIDIPRLGEEVIVDFIEGDPDKPIITGRVYNGEVTPPFPLDGESNATNKTRRGNSTKTYKGGGFNEMSMDDTPGKEQIRVHGQFNMDTVIEHDQTHTVHNDRTRQVDKNEKVTIGVDRNESVGSNESLKVGKNRTEDVGVNETLSVGSDRTRSVGKNETVTVGLTRTHSVGINEAITVGAAQEVTVGGLRAVTVGLTQATTVGKSQTTTIGTNLTETIGGNSTHTTAKDRKVKVGKGRGTDVGTDDKLKVGKILAIQAGDEVAIKVGEAMLRMKKDGTINLKGKDITIDGSGKVTIKAKKDIVLKANGNILEN